MVDTVTFDQNGPLTVSDGREHLFLTKSAEETKNKVPGLPEMGVGLLVFAACIFLLAIGLWLIPDSHASLRGSVGSAGNGAAGVLALLAAVRLRNMNINAFGFRAVGLPWINAGILLGFVAVGLSMGIEHIYFSYVQEADTQADFKAAATSSLFSLMMLCLTGAILTPFGEEVLFRGVVATALNRYGPSAGIIGSARDLCRCTWARCHFF